MKIAYWPRLALVSMLAIAIAIALGVQALSSVSTRTAPELAVRILPANGLAREQLAFANFTAEVSEPDDMSGAAKAASKMAREAVRFDPLTPKAHAILALAQSNDELRRAVLEVASRLNRRDLSLQGLALQEYMRDQDYPRTIETLDQILRVNPEYSREFFPVLGSALAEEETIPLFAEMLNGGSPWHERFLAYAVGQQEILPNLARLRPQISLENEDFDRRLISGLAGTGDITGAESLYERVSGSNSGLLSQGVLDWRSTYPPFDWRFVDEPGFRAQQSSDGQELELSVRPGKGGVIAARLLSTPPTPFMVRIEHRIAPADQLRDVRLQLICAGNATAFFDERFSRQGEGFRVQEVPEDCAYLVIAMNARAWSGRSALSGTIEIIKLS